MIHALWHSANPRKLAPIARVNRLEFSLAVVVLFAVLILDTLPAIIQEMLLTTSSERQGRVIDHDQSASMEKKKQEGYF